MGVSSTICIVEVPRHQLADRAERVPCPLIVGIITCPTVLESPKYDYTFSHLMLRLGCVSTQAM